jgi:hypothetical protein
MEDRRGAYRVWWGYQIERVHLEFIDIDSRVIFKRIFLKWEGET